MQEHNRYPGTTKLLSIWRRIREKYGATELYVVGGGEPFDYPDFNALVAGLSELHTIKIITNFSGDIEALGRIVRPDSVELITTFHPLSVSVDSFIEKGVLAKQIGFRFSANMVGYPPFFHDIPYYTDAFRARGLWLGILPFWGEYQGHKFPESYSQENIAMMKPFLSGRDSFSNKYHAAMQQPAGKFCHAGHLYAAISADGGTFRCAGDSLKPNAKPFSNIFDDNFELLNAPLPCESAACVANEGDNLLVVDTTENT